MKTAFFFSIFAHNNIAKSMRYILDLCRNIKVFQNNQLYNKGYYIIINTDEFTQKVILDIIKQEQIKMINVFFKIWNRNMQLRGMIWRFESFISDEYDITINAEGDYQLEKYFPMLATFDQYKDVAAYFINVRQCKINENWIAAGAILIRPKLISLEQKLKMKMIINAINDFDHVHYGIDEKVLSIYIKTLFTNSKLLIVVDHLHQIFQHIIDPEGDILYLKNIFKNSYIVSINEINKQLKSLSPLILNTENGLLKYKNDNEYQLNDIKYILEKPLRVTIKQEKEDEILNIIKKIINKNILYISNNCVGARIYQQLNRQFDNPFIWCRVSAENMEYLIKNFNDINFLNYKLVSYHNKIQKYEIFGIKIDNKIIVWYPHYKKDEACIKPEKRVGNGLDIYYYDIETYIIEKYEKRVKRMLEKDNIIQYIIIEDNKQENMNYTKEALQKFSNNKDIIVISRHNNSIVNPIESTVYIAENIIKTFNL